MRIRIMQGSILVSIKWSKKIPHYARVKWISKNTALIEIRTIQIRTKQGITVLA